MKRAILATAVILAPPCFADVELTADSAPTDKPWTAPATINLIRDSNGSNTGTVDAVFTYSSMKESLIRGARAPDITKLNGETIHKNSLSDSIWVNQLGLSAYIHYDSTESAPKNDRGLSLNYGGTYIPGSPDIRSVMNIGIAASLSGGSTLAEVTTTNGDKDHRNRNSDRETLYLTGYFQPAESSKSIFAEAATSFYHANAGIYSDHLSGGDGTGTGRLTGSLVSIDANFAPWGLEPRQISKGLNCVPLLQLAAQREQDHSSSGSREKSTYKLYTATFSLAFGRVGSRSSGFVPSLNLSRSVGADLLTSTPYQRKTMLSLGLTY
jgi:hypothetical protein